MNVLVKWFRKNRMKVMVIVGVVLMIGFIGGSSLQQLLRSQRTGASATVALMGEKTKITNYDLAIAQNEMQILRMLRADLLLKGRDMSQTLLGELVFSERSGGSEIIANIKKMVRSEGYPVSNRQINDMYRPTLPSHVYWHVLKTEAEQAGVVVSNEQAAAQLAQIIPQITGGGTYAQYMKMLLQGGRGERGLPEEEVLNTFAKLLAVLDYARIMCTSESFTTSQIRQMVNAEMERFDVEYVKLDTNVFARAEPEPSEAALQTQFDKYKDDFVGDMSEGNPYGFGYKVPDRAKLEYMVVKLDDVKGIVTAPTREETQAEYRKRADEFTRQVPIDPNDPNSQMIDRRESYADVSDRLAERMLQDRIDTTAGKIMQEARGLLEPSFEELNLEPGEITGEHFKLRAISYGDVAAQLSEKYKVKLYTGSTGMLSASDIAGDKWLGRMVMQGYGYLYNPVPLMQMVFAIDEIGATELGPFEAAKPRMYETIGPFKEMYIPTTVMLVRVTQARKAAPADSLDQTFSTETVKIDEADAGNNGKVYSVRERVTDDLKRLTVRNVVKDKAEEFVRLAGEVGWNDAVPKFNELYGDKLKEEPNDPNVFRLEDMKGLRRITAKAMETLQAQVAGTPGARIRVNAAKVEQSLTNAVYSLVPPDSNSLRSGPAIVEFKGDISYFVIKDVVIDRVTEEEYREAKSMTLYGEELARAQTLAFVYYNPQNILGRANFRYAKETEQEEVADTNQ